MVYPALLNMMCTPRLPVVDWTDAQRRFKLDSYVSPKDEIWFLGLCYYISTGIYNCKNCLLVSMLVCLYEEMQVTNHSSLSSSSSVRQFASSQQTLHYISRRSSWEQKAPCILGW